MPAWLIIAHDLFIKLTSSPKLRCEARAKAVGHVLGEVRPRRRREQHCPKGLVKDQAHARVPPGRALHVTVQGGQPEFYSGN